ncbi:enhancer of filamentation 1-like isoform X2 [Artemia franciscana]|uniref:SH3 domain-containing protein n=2 Tax=Artemia franciscana TaxID=6661 RepID=A0AA88KUL5_ARTSF|nr:hypothetical protein QYM36_018430 [Artemia franciscana]
MTTNARAIYDNVADSPDELAFRKGDLLVVVDQNPAGLEGQEWWLCSLRGREGLCPANRLKILPCNIYSAKNSTPIGPSTPTTSCIPSNGRNGYSSNETVSRRIQNDPTLLRSKKILKPTRVGDTFLYIHPDRDKQSSSSHEATECVNLPDYDVPRSRQVVDQGNEVSCYDTPKPLNEQHYDSPRSALHQDPTGKESNRSSGTSLLSSSSGYSSFLNVANESPNTTYSNSPGEADTYDTPRPLKSNLIKAGENIWRNRSFETQSCSKSAIDNLSKSFDTISLDASDGNETYDIPPRRGHPEKLDSIISALSEIDKLPNLNLPPKTKKVLPPTSNNEDYDTPIPSTCSIRNKLGSSFRSHRSAIPGINCLPLPPKVGRRPISNESDVMQDYSIPHPVSKDISKPKSEEKEEPVYGSIVRNMALTEVDRGLVQFDELKSKVIKTIEVLSDLKYDAPYSEEVLSALKKETASATLSFEKILELALIYLKTAKKVDLSFANRLETVVKPLINGRKILKEIVKTLEIFPKDLLSSLTFQKRMKVTIDQLQVCTKNLIQDIKAFSICIHDNGKKLFQPSVDDWIDDYDYVKLDSRSSVHVDEVDNASGVHCNLQTVFNRMVVESTSIIPSELPTLGNAELLQFYKPYVEQHRKQLANSIDTFLNVIESKEQPSVFISFARFIVINAFKLVFIGDSIARHSSESIAKVVSDSSDKLCKSVKVSVETINRGAKEFPSHAAVQRMFDAVVHVAEKGTEFYDLILQLTV